MIFDYIYKQKRKPDQVGRVSIQPGQIVSIHPTLKDSETCYLYTLLRRWEVIGNVDALDTAIRKALDKIHKP